ncbi:ATP-binding cassette domain-containing protein, partial [uncultured Bifidobacterium sp.]|uniref:ATP-binding cassette domain-containing protein n=1 Tax=uncultured Bifidobacterium sp. TaxID=165187 RepID=UPI002582B1A6
SALSRAAALVMQDVHYQLFAESVRAEVMLETVQAGGELTAAREQCDALLGELDLLDVADRHPMSLSGGQKQRLAIAVALMGKKRFVVLDEPTSGLDRAHMMQVGALLRELADRGVAVLVITHDDELAAHWCDRILALD